MKEELISFETAKLAKEKGFNISTNSWYDENFKTSEQHFVFFTNETVGLRYGHKCDIKKINYAPTQSLLQKWLREKHEIDIWVERYNSERFYYQCPKVHEMSITKNIRLDHWGDKYEEALEKGLQEALKLI